MDNGVESTDTEIDEASETWSHDQPSGQWFQAHFQRAQAHCSNTQCIVWHLVDNGAFKTQTV